MSNEELRQQFRSAVRELPNIVLLDKAFKLAKMASPRTTLEKLELEILEWEVYRRFGRD